MEIKLLVFVIVAESVVVVEVFVLVVVYHSSCFYGRIHLSCNYHGRYDTHRSLLQYGVSCKYSSSLSRNLWENMNIAKLELFCIMTHFIPCPCQTFILIAFIFISYGLFSLSFR